MLKNRFSATARMGPALWRKGMNAAAAEFLGFKHVGSEIWERRIWRCSQSWLHYIGVIIIQDAFNKSNIGNWSNWSPFHFLSYIIGGVMHNKKWCYTSYPSPSRDGLFSSCSDKDSLFSYLYAPPVSTFFHLFPLHFCIPSIGRISRFLKFRLVMTPPSSFTHWLGQP